MKSIIYPSLPLVLVLSSFATCPSTNALAQIVPDNTLGAESSVVVPNVSIDGLPSDQIEGGALRGELLFHSFGDFNIAEGRGAYFANPAAVNTIFSRVTGANPSDILGTLGVLGDADLVFLNPNGILFGPNARLDLRGSFTGSTASGIEMPNGDVFSALAPEVPSLLTLNTEAPIGLVFEGANAQAITNEGILVAPEDLTLAATNLDLQGQLYAGQDLNLQAQETIQIRDSEQSPFIAASGDQLTVQGNQTVDIFALNHPGSGLFSGGDMTLRSDNPVNGDAHYWSSGNFQIEQTDDTLGNLFSEYDPIIRSQGDVSFFGYQGTSLHILSGGSVDINTVIITGPDTTGDSINPVSTPELANVTLSDGTSLVIDGGARATLDIRAGIDPSVIGNPLGTSSFTPDSDLFVDALFLPIMPPEANSVVSNADIKIGDVIVRAPDGLILLTNTYKANPRLQGNITITGEGFILLPGGRDFNGIGLSGNSDTLDNESLNLALDSRGNILLEESVVVQTAPRGSNVGSGGSILMISEENISFQERNSLFSQGSIGGNITLISNKDITAISSDFLSLSLSDLLEGTGGDIDVIANGSIIFSEGSLAATATFGSITSGNVSFQSGELISFKDTIENVAGGVRSQIEPEANGNGGNVSISTPRLQLLDGAQISTSTFGRGNSGDITITTSDLEMVGESPFDGDNSGIFSDSVVGSFGNGGNINIFAERFYLSEGAEVSASSKGGGNAGNLIVIATEMIEGVGTSQDENSTTGLFANVNSLGRGDGGDLQIFTNYLRLVDGAQVATNTLGAGDAGDVLVEAGLIDLIGTSNRYRSGLFVRVDVTGTGDGGQLNLTARELFISDGAVISATTLGEGNAGNLVVDVEKLEIRSGSRVTVGGLGSGRAGDLNISARTLALDEGELIAETLQSGGNINLRDIDFLLMRNGSRISAEAFNQARGGNVIIDAGEGFVFAISSENSDIIADAFQGNGGIVDITAQGIFGIEFRGQQTPYSDITASSQLGNPGRVNINTPDIDPNQGLNILPEQPREIVVADACQTTNNQNTVAFFNLGQGGTSPGPGDSAANFDLGRWISMDVLESRPSARIDERLYVDADPATDVSFASDIHRSQLLISCRGS